MKPFNLERAKAGDPVVTRDGREFIFGAYNPNAKDGHNIIGWLNEVVTSYFKSGRLYAGREHGADLFMASKKRTVWVNLYAPGGGVRGYFYSTETAADEAAASTRLGGKARPIEIEE